MRKLHTKIWNNAIKRKIGVAYVDGCNWYNSEDFSIYRLITEEENKEYNLFGNLSLVCYNDPTIEMLNTRPYAVDLVTGEIKQINYRGSFPENICRKMLREYSKSYFDKFEDKIELR